MYSFQEYTATSITEKYFFKKTKRHGWPTMLSLFFLFLANEYISLVRWSIHLMPFLLFFVSFLGSFDEADV